MFISAAYAAGEAASAATEASPEAWEALASQMGMVLIIVVLFYVMLIMPQQKRFKEQKQMLDSLKKGDEVITAGGLIGKVHKVVDKQEVIIELGEGNKVRALRSTIQTRSMLFAQENPTASKKKEKEDKEKSQSKDKNKNKKEKTESTKKSK